MLLIETNKARYIILIIKNINKLRFINKIIITAIHIYTTRQKKIKNAKLILDNF